MTRLYAIYREPEQLLTAIRTLRARGFERLEAYTPYPVDGLPEALALPSSPLPLYAFVMGLSTAAATYALEWWLNAYLYPINVGARPPHFPLSYVPICFEMGILAAAFTVITGVALYGRFGRLWDPVFELPDFESVSRDRHWLELTLGEREDIEAGSRVLDESGAERVVRAEVP